MVRLLGGSSTLGSVAAQLLLGLGTGSALGLADSGGTGNGSLAEVGTVATLGNVVRNVLVGPIRKRVSR